MLAPAFALAFVLAFAFAIALGLTLAVALACKCFWVREVGMGRARGCAVLAETKFAHVCPTPLCKVLCSLSSRNNPSRRPCHEPS